MNRGLQSSPRFFALAAIVVMIMARIAAAAIIIAAEYIVVAAAEQDKNDYDQYPNPVAVAVVAAAVVTAE